MAFIPKSMEFKPEEISATVKARTHLIKAEEVKVPHFQYLELWKGFEALYKDKEKPTTKLLANRGAGREASELDMMGALLTSMTRPRLEQLLAHEDIPQLMMLLGKKNMKKLLGENELHGEAGLTEQAWQHAKQDLTYNLKANYWKAGEGLARVLFLVRGSADPKVRKTDNLVSDEAVLKCAYGILRFAIRSLTDQEGEDHDDFMGVGKRTKVAEDARKKAMQARAKKA